MNQTERVEKLQDWLSDNVSWPDIDADDLLAWIGQNMEVGDVFDLDGPEVQAIIDEALENSDSHRANERDVDRALRLRAERL